MHGPPVSGGGGSDSAERTIPESSTTKRSLSAVSDRRQIRQRTGLPRHGLGGDTALIEPDADPVELDLLNWLGCSEITHLIEARLREQRGAS